MNQRLQGKRENEESLIVFIGISISIMLGIFVTTGDNPYLSNVLIKILGILLPITLVLIFTLARNRPAKLMESKKRIIWVLLLLSFVVFQISITPSLSQLLLGSPDRNLGGFTFGICVLTFIIGKFFAEGVKKWLAISLISFGVVQSLVVAYQKFVAPIIQYEFGFTQLPNVTGTFYNANPLSFFLGMIAAGTFSYFLNSEYKSKESIFLLGSVVISFLGLLWSNSIQGLIGFLVTSSLFALRKFIRLDSKKESIFLPTIFGVALTIFVIYVFLVKLPSKNVSLDPILERLEIYKTSLRMSFMDPLTGIGVDQFASKYGQFTPLKDMKLVDNAHSIPLQILTTHGLVGLLFMLTFTFWVLSLRQNTQKSSASEWSFWQAIFFSYSIIGIIGIEHPVIASSAFLAAGMLSGLSSTVGGTKKNRPIMLSSKFLHLSVTALSVILLFCLISLGKSEFNVSNAIDSLSKGKISDNDFHRTIQGEISNLYNAKLFLVVGDAYIALDRKNDALYIANLMLSKFPDDQRSGVLFLKISNKWADQVSMAIAEKQRKRLFPNIP